MRKNEMRINKKKKRRNRSKYKEGEEEVGSRSKK